MSKGFKDNFYGLLAREVEDFGFEKGEPLPFLCEFLRRSKSFSKESIYSKCMKLRRDYKEGRIDEARCFVGLLDVLAKGKYALATPVFATATKTWRGLCKAYGVEAHEKYFGHKKQLRIMASEIASEMKQKGKGKKTVGLVFPRGVVRSLGELMDVAEKEALIFAAKDWLYDVRSTSGDGTSGRKVDKTMAMMDEFFRREGTKYYLENYDKVGVGGAGLSEEDIKSAERLCALMANSKDFEDAFLPLYIDRMSGMGLYIYGNNRVYSRGSGPLGVTGRGKGPHFRGSGTEDEGPLCAYAILQFREAAEETSPNDYCKAPVQLTYDRVDALDPPGRLGETWSRFEAYRTGSVEELYEGYCGYNGDMPNGCPPEFAKYFYFDEDFELEGRSGSGFGDGGFELANPAAEVEALQNEERRHKESRRENLKEVNAPLLNRKHTSW